MARGWQSTAAAEAQIEQPVAQTSTINQQVAAKEASAELATPSFEQRQRLDSLRLMRSQVNEQLQRARSVSQRQMLHHQLQAIEVEISTLETKMN